jgi:hypothetical protein
MTVPALELTQFTVTEPAPGYWRATFDHPPTNLMNTVTAAELRAIVEAGEEAGDLRVLVLDSASAEYFFARYDLSAGPLPPDPGPTGLRRPPNLASRITGSDVRYPANSGLPVLPRYLIRRTASSGSGLLRQIE